VPIRNNKTIIKKINLINNERQKNSNNNNKNKIEKNSFNLCPGMYTEHEKHN